jgi:glycosyltransferase involved in cell wall biosynthesis
VTLRVSVVIPTYLRPDLLLRCLGGVLAQRLPPGAYEIIVVDDGHDEATRVAVERLAATPTPVRLRYLRPVRGRGPAVARNAGWRAAKAPLVAFTDDDTVPQPDWLLEGERAMTLHPDWSAACGRVVVPRAAVPPTDHELMTLGLERAEFVTANAFVRRAALLRVDGFDERFRRAWGEDSDLQFRLMQTAGPVGRAADAVIHHPVRPERWGICLRQQKNAFFDALLYKKHPQLYRERIHPAPPWNYYAIVGLVGAALVLGLAGAFAAAGVALVIAVALMLTFALRRIGPTSHAPGHVVEMLATSAVIPFLSVYWRLRGALHFKVLFL